jgi:hypothetical protein
MLALCCVVQFFSNSANSLLFPAQVKIPEMTLLFRPLAFGNDSTFDFDHEPLINCQWDSNAADFNFSYVIFNGGSFPEGGKASSG